MSTYLQLCQDVARESGTFPTIGSPETVLNQSARLARLVYWVRDAYNDIQRARSDWRWLREDFSGQTIQNVREYDAAAMNIERFSHWLYQSERGIKFFSIYKTSTGQDDERRLRFQSYDEFRALYEFGGAATYQNQPQVVSENDQRNLVLYPTPDDVYTLRGRYVKGLQTLSQDNDIPEMPERFHEAIKWRALILLGNFDEATTQQPFWMSEYGRLMRDLIHDQTPRIEEAEPLA